MKTRLKEQAAYTTAAFLRSVGGSLPYLARKPKVTSFAVEGKASLPQTVHFILT